MKTTKLIVVKLVIEHEGATPEEIIQEMDYNFTSTVDNTEILETEIIDIKEVP